ncbi:facilitated trehalose transporter Tret1 [Parasteatoda tepidariorum]|uniref:facilitated trehalose transporter Tret1 n=1 Tax=Parasteatoda tepidariorum TaxID=114398 RepID=UPI00077FCA72|nr:facilitated trehalose transporter Tret1 [Parasteatoda tepidariorum]
MVSHPDVSKFDISTIGASTGTSVSKDNLRNTHVAAGSALLYVAVLGMLTSYSAPATADMKEPGSRFRDLTPDQTTWIGSLPNLGCLIGNITFGYVTHAFGRKAAMMLLSLFYLLSWLSVAYAPTLIWIYIGRLVGGICGGASCVAIPTYLVEIAPTKIRGQLTSGFQIANTIGAFLIMSLGIILRWSWLAISGASVVACASCIMLFMPESPPWLLRSSRSTEAIRGLKFLKGKQCNIEKELIDILGSIQYKEERIALRDFLDSKFFKPAFISLALMFFQQACGIGPLLAYTVEIFQTSRSSIDPSIAAAMVALVEVIGSIANGSLIDRSGRKFLYITSYSFMSISLLFLGFYNFVLVRDPISVRSYGYVPLICIVVYKFSYSLGSGSIPYIMIPELVPIKHRSVVMAMGGVMCSLVAFVSNKSFEVLRVLLGDYGVYWTYGSISFISVVFGFCILPETKGLTILQINESFSNVVSK